MTLWCSQPSALATYAHGLSFFSHGLYTSASTRLTAVRAAEWARTIWNRLSSSTVLTTVLTGAVSLKTGKPSAAFSASGPKSLSASWCVRRHQCSACVAGWGYLSVAIMCPVGASAGFSSLSRKAACVASLTASASSAVNLGEDMLLELCWGFYIKVPSV